MDATIRLDVYSILLFMSIGQLLVSSLFLMNQRKKIKSTLLLLIVLFIFCLNIIEPVFIWTHFLYAVPHFLYIGPFFLLLLGPGLYLYMLSIKNKSFKWKKIYVLHVVPFVFSKFWGFPNFFQTATKKREIIQHFYDVELTGSASNLDFNLAAFLFQLHPVVYFLTSIYIVLSDLKTNEKSRFNKFHSSFFVGLTVVIGFYLFGHELSFLSLEHYWKILSVLMFTFVCFISYVFSQNLMKPKNMVKLELKDHNSKEMYLKIKAVILNEELYLNPKLTLNMIASRVGLSPRLVSKLINEYDERNFSDFINSYRVEKAKHFICDVKMDHYTLEAIAKEAGFSNKMSFNRAFKKMVNMTPSAYKAAMK